MPEFSLNDLGPEVIVKDGGSTQTVGDKHNDPDSPPTLNPLGGTWAAPGFLMWDATPPSSKHHPTDAAHKIIGQVAGNIVAATVFLSVTFATPYKNSDGDTVPPNVLVADESPVPHGVVRALNVTATGYQLVADTSMANNEIVKFRISVIPCQ